MAVLCLLAGPALAHSAIPGIGNFYNGALHPFVSSAHLIALLALGLGAGQRGLSGAKAPLVALAAALALGLGAHRVAGDPDTDRLLLVLAASMGLAAAAQWRAPMPMYATLAAATGLAVGLASGPQDIDGAARWTLLAGSFAGATLLCTYVAAMVTLAQQAWLRIAVRVMSSWIAAAALLVLALSFAAKRGA